jgi:hypothetical protein
MFAGVRRRPDYELSRQKQGFETPRERQQYQWVIFLSFASVPYPAEILAQERRLHSSFSMRLLSRSLL